MAHGPSCVLPDLTVNERKSRLVKLPEGPFDFPGYAIGRFCGASLPPVAGFWLAYRAFSPGAGVPARRIS